MGKVAEQAHEVQIAPANPKKSIADMLKRQWPKIEAVMPKHMSSERMYQIAVSTVNQTPLLAECDVNSLMSCVMKCSALGLEPSAVDGLGRAYILPYRNKGRMTATLIVGYKGMLDLARRSGEIGDISARAVYEGDDFEYEFGLDEKLRHVPSQRKREKDEKPTHVYMVAHFKDGGHYMDVMTIDEVEAVRARSKAADNGPWKTDFEAMAKKTVIRRSFPYLPVSVEAQQAAAADETTPDYTGVFDPVISDDEPIIEEIRDVPTRASCKNCGNVVEVAEDASLEDLNQMGCCEKPEYGWEEQ